MPDEGNTIMIELPDEVADNIPDVPRELIAGTPYLIGGEDARELEAISNGTCLACGGKFGEATSVLVGGTGIIFIVCSPLCLDDFHIHAFLMEQAKDIEDKLQFRGEHSGE